MGTYVIVLHVKTIVCTPKWYSFDSTTYGSILEQENNTSVYTRGTLCVLNVIPNVDLRLRAIHRRLPMS